MGPGWNANGKGPAGTNFDVTRGAFDSAYAGRGQYDREMELDAEKNYFGLRSYADTALFMTMSDSDHGSINDALKNAGVSLSDIREGGLQAISGIDSAGSMADLKKLYADEFSKRSDMTAADRDEASKALDSGNLKEAKSELVRIMAGKGQADDTGTNIRDAAANPPPRHLTRLTGFLRRARNAHQKDKSRQSLQMRPNCATWPLLSRRANQEKHIGEEHDAR